MKNSTAILALLVFARRSRTKNTENNKFFSNFQFQLLNYLGADCEKQIISSRDCNEVSVSNQFIRCLRLFKKLIKKIYDGKTCFNGFNFHKYPIFLCINLLSIF